MQKENKNLLKKILIGGLIGLGVGVIGVSVFSGSPLDLLIHPFYMLWFFVLAYPVEFFSSLSSDPFLNIAVGNFLQFTPYLFAWISFGIVCSLVWSQLRKVTKKRKKMLYWVIFIITWLILIVASLFLTLPGS